MNLLTPPPKLSPARTKRLAAFLASPARPAGTLPLDALHGFLFALLAAPENPRPSEWMPRIFGGGDAVYADVEEANEILGSLMALYNQTNASILAGRPRLPKGCRPLPDPLANFGPTGALGRWAVGFMAGHAYLHEAWAAAVPKPLEGEVAASVYTLSFFRDRASAERLRAGRGGHELTLEQEARALAAIVEDAMHSYAHIGRSIYQALAGVGIETVRRSAASTKVGRNDACPCGSGRKFKHCCGAPATRH